MRLFVLLALLASCSMTPTETLREDVMANRVSLNAVLNLGTTSFIKGCVFGTQTHAFEGIKPSKLEYCKAAAAAHTEDLKVLLK